MHGLALLHGLASTANTWKISYSHKFTVHVSSFVPRLLTIQHFLDLWDNLECEKFGYEVTHTGD